MVDCIWGMNDVPGHVVESVVHYDAGKLSLSVWLWELEFVMEICSNMTVVSLVVVLDCMIRHGHHWPAIKFLQGQKKEGGWHRTM